MLGGAHGDALYPQGSASERYVLSFYEGQAGGKLIYERRQKGLACVEWPAPFVPNKRKSHVSGTVRRYLQSLGFEISHKAHLWPEERKLLTARSKTIH